MPVRIIVVVLFALLHVSSLLAQTQLRRGRTVEGSLSAGDTARYTIDAGPDFFVFGEVQQLTVDVVLRAIGPDGTQLARVDGPARGAERFSGNLDKAGTYTLEVIPADDDGSGEYSITLHRFEPVENDPEDYIDQVMSRWDGDSPGGAVRVWRNGRTLFSKAYGMANLGYDIPFETDTYTNIGSTSKQFTAFAVMLQAVRGHLSLDDDIREHIPELPMFEHTITVRHLLNHTGGLREFLNLLAMTGRRLDHGDWIDRGEIIDIVQRQPALQNKPGDEWNYNNTAFGLAAVIVERTSGQAFHEFMRDEVFLPLGMTRTMVRATPEMTVPHKAEGYTPGEDGFREIGDLGGAVGAGGIYSTIEDLQRWVENYANPTLGTAQMIEEMMTEFMLNDGEGSGYGLGLFVDEQRGLRRIHHGGADVAHRSMLVYYPEINAGVTTQSNHAMFNSNLAFEIGEKFFGDHMEPEAEPVADGAPFDPASFDPESFDDFVGRYALDAQPSFVLTFSREGDSLFTQATGQPKFPIFPIGEMSFELRVVEASLTFHRDDDGEVTGVTLFQNGENHATRLADDDAPEEWKPDTYALKDFVGRYFSDELETFYDVALDNDTLVVSHRRLDDITLSPAEEDNFNGAPFTFAFERDRNNVVIGFYLNYVRTRDVRFRRVR